MITTITTFISNNPDKVALAGIFFFLLVVAIILIVDPFGVE
jgi:hypothetical protein